MDAILDKIVYLCLVLLLLVLLILAKRAYNYLKSLMSKEDAAKLDSFVWELVAAAEQMYKEKDPTGAVRLDYVQGMLMEAGYEITEAIRAKIESCVLKLGGSK